MAAGKAARMIFPPRNVLCKVSIRLLIEPRPSVSAWTSGGASFASPVPVHRPVTGTAGAGPGNGWPTGAPGEPLEQGWAII